MTNCKDVTRKIASGEFREAGWREWLSVRFHLLLCRLCRRYEAQLRVIGAAARKLCGPLSQDPSTLERLERQILERSRRGAEDPNGTSERQSGNVDPH